MTEKEVVSLKEFIEAKLCASERLSKERFEYIASATRLQAKEYERRLDLLNGEAERLRRMQATYLPRESADFRYNELLKKVEENTNWRNNMEGRMVILALGISAGASTIITILIRFLFD